MGSSPLGPKWLRRIARVTQMDIVHASGYGGYWHNFTTADHRHGQIHAVSLEWCWTDPKDVRHGTACRRLFPDP